MKTQIKEGDIFELKTPSGFVYLHYLFQDPNFSELIRVLPGIYTDRPKYLESLADSKELFMIHFPLLEVYKKKIVEKVGFSSVENIEVPKFFRSMHTIRGIFIGWYIFERSTLKKTLVQTLSEEQKQLSHWGIYNESILIDLLEIGWNLENWEYKIDDY